MPSVEAQKFDPRELRQTPPTPPVADRSHRAEPDLHIEALRIQEEAEEPISLDEIVEIDRRNQEQAKADVEAIGANIEGHARFQEIFGEEPPTEEEKALHREITQEDRDAALRATDLPEMRLDESDMYDVRALPPRMPHEPPPIHNIDRINIEEGLKQGTELSAGEQLAERRRARDFAMPLDLKMPSPNQDYNPSYIPTPPERAALLKTEDPKYLFSDLMHEFNLTFPINDDGSVSGFFNKRKFNKLLKKNSAFAEKYYASKAQYDTHIQEHNPMNVPVPKSFSQKLRESKMGRWLMGASLAGGLAANTAVRHEQARTQAKIERVQTNPQSQDTAPINPLANRIEGNTIIGVDTNTDSVVSETTMEGSQFDVKLLPHLQVGDAFPMAVFGGKGRVRLGDTIPHSLSDRTLAGTGVVLDRPEHMTRTAAEVAEGDVSQAPTGYVIEKGKIVKVLKGHDDGSLGSELSVALHQANKRIETHLAKKAIAQRFEAAQAVAAMKNDVDLSAVNAQPALPEDNSDIRKRMTEDVSPSAAATLDGSDLQAKGGSVGTGSKVPRADLTRMNELAAESAKKVDALLAEKSQQDRAKNPALQPKAFVIPGDTPYHMEERDRDVRDRIAARQAREKQRKLHENERQENAQ